MNVVDFEKERYEVFSSLDKNKTIKFCKKNNFSFPDDEEDFWIFVHKAICNLFLFENTLIEISQFNANYEWLIKHGCKPFEKKDEK